jgi:hypothetical protein
MRLTWVLYIVAAVCVAAEASQLDKVSNASVVPDDVDQLFRDFFRWKLKSQPQEASLTGFGNFTDQVIFSRQVLPLDRNLHFFR